MSGFGLWDRKALCLQWLSGARPLGSMFGTLPHCGAQEGSFGIAQEAVLNPSCPYGLDNLRPVSFPLCKMG